jgi:hypothetical protein
MEYFLRQNTFCCIKLTVTHLKLIETTHIMFSAQGKLNNLIPSKNWEPPPQYLENFKSHTILNNTSTKNSQEIKNVFI